MSDLKLPTIEFTEHAAIAWALFQYGVEIRKPTHEESLRAQRRWGRLTQAAMCAFVDGELVDAWQPTAWRAVATGHYDWKYFGTLMAGMSAQRGARE